MTIDWNSHPGPLREIFRTDFARKGGSFCLNIFILILAKLTMKIWLGEKVGIKLIRNQWECGNVGLWYSVGNAVLMVSWCLSLKLWVNLPLFYIENWFYKHARAQPVSSMEYLQYGDWCPWGNIWYIQYGHTFFYTDFNISVRKWENELKDYARTGESLASA